MSFEWTPLDVAYSRHRHHLRVQARDWLLVAARNLDDDFDAEQLRTLAAAIHHTTYDIDNLAALHQEVARLRKWDRSRTLVAGAALLVVGSGLGSLVTLLVLYTLGLAG